MSSLKRSTLIAVALTVIYFGAAARTNADPLVLIVDNPNPTAASGTWITFTGTLTNSTLLAFDIQGFGITHSPGLIDFGDIAVPPNFLTDPGPMSSVSGGVLSVRISPTIEPGSYFAMVVVNGLFANGSSGSASYELNITVTNPSAVPEPSSILLLGTGLISAGALARRYRKRSSDVCH